MCAHAETAQAEGIVMTHSARELGEATRTTRLQLVCAALQITPLPSPPALGVGLLCPGSGDPGSNSVGSVSTQASAGGLMA